MKDYFIIELESPNLDIAVDRATKQAKDRIEQLKESPVTYRVRFIELEIDVYNYKGYSSYKYFFEVRV